MKQLLQLSFIIILCSCNVTNLQGQVYSRIAVATYYNNLNFDYLAINPASAGAYQYVDARIQTENDINSITPQLFSVSTSIDLKDGKFAIGGRFGYFEKEDILHSQYNIYLARHFRLSDDLSLSFGASPSLLHRKGEGQQIVGNQSVTFPINDYLPNLGIGTMLTYSNLFQIGIALPSTFSQTYWSNENNNEIQEIKKGYLSASFMKNLNLSRTLVGMAQVRIENTKLFNQNNIYYQDISSIVSMDMGLRIYEAVNFGVTLHDSFNDLNNRKIDFWATYFFRNGTRIGTTIQVPNNRINNQILCKVIVGYSFDYKESLIISPGYIF